jgi:RHS repeat-associated protein
VCRHGGVKIVYDGDGNRVKETVATVTTSYLVADQNPTGYAQVLDELQGGSVTRTYSYGLELINERQPLAGTLTTSFYGYDGHGSVRFLTSSTGAITDTYDYDAFGNVISSTGSTPNNYLFAGEQFDPALGVYYNRARYYDQRQGRFWTMDTYEGGDVDPISLHKYLYGGANPSNKKDPSGEDFIDVVAAVQVYAIGVAQALGPILPALQFAVAGLNIYLFTTDQEFRDIVLATGPQAATEFVAEDVRLITQTPAAFFRNLKGLGLGADAMEQLAALRKDLSVPAAGTKGGDKFAFSKLVIGDLDWLGMSGHGQDVTLTVHPISEGHAETDVFQQAANLRAVAPEAIKSDHGVLYVDRELCWTCGRSGAVKSMARQVGLKTLTVVTPEGIVDWDLR